jgi:hypothetical protein
MVPIAVAAIFAIAVQPLVYLAWLVTISLVSSGSVEAHEFGNMAFWVSMVATPFVVVIGIPLFLTLRRFNRVTVGHMAATGFLTAALPLALLNWPGFFGAGYSSGGSWNGHYVEFIRNGTATSYGWIQYIAVVVEFGLQGLVGAIVFLFVWRHLGGPNNRFERSRDVSSLGQGEGR